MKLLIWSKKSDEEFVDTFHSEKSKTCYRVEKITFDPAIMTMAIDTINYYIIINGAGDPWIDAGQAGPTNTMAGLCLVEEKC